MLSDYEMWWLSCVKEYLWTHVYVEDCDCEQWRSKEARRHIFNPKKYNISMNASVACEMNDSLSVMTEDYEILIPEENPKILIVKCNENKTKYERRLSISLRVFEFGRSMWLFEVRQKACDGEFQYE